MMEVLKGAKVYDRSHGGNDLVTFVEYDEDDPAVAVVEAADGSRRRVKETELHYAVFANLKQVRR
jgi:hypothetical protein